MIASAAALNETERGEIEDTLSELAGASPTLKVGQGFAKLLVDRMTFEEPDEAAGERRAQAFDAGTTALRSLPDEALPDTFESLLTESLGEALPKTRALLYADLPDARKRLDFETIDAEGLLLLWNLAQVQGLLFRAKRLEITAQSPDIRRLRRVLRWLKFCRLVGEVTRDGDAWRIAVEGPAAILDTPKKYGLQLAQFMAVVPLLPRWSLKAELEFTHGRPVPLVLDETAPLASPHERALGWIPDEIEVMAKKLSEGIEPWTLDLTPAPYPVGSGALCVPDFTFTAPGNRVLRVEFFHRWHRHQAVRRLDDLRLRPDETLIVGIDQSLLSDEDLAARAEGHPQVMTFKGFPSERKLRALLAARS